MDNKDTIQQAAEALKKANALFITAGAGIGVDSGLPDFRGKEGFWNAYPPIAQLGLSFSEMANPRWFEKKPYLAWAFYGHRLNLYRETTPHKGFYQILELAENMPGGYFVFTSNVDGQFQKAGYDENRIEECHGSIHHLQCTIPCGYDIWDGSTIEIVVDMDKFEAAGPLPRCKKCGALARPNILMFGDWSWIPARTDAQSERLSEWLQKIRWGKYTLAVIEMGAGHAVPTVRWKSESVARSLNGTLIRINPRDYETPAGHISLPTGSAEGINQIVEKMK